MEGRSVRQRIDAGEYRNTADYSSDRDAWRREESRIVAQFWQDVAAQFDAQHYPPAAWEKVTALAWAHGHSSGLAEVLYWVEEFCDLLDTL